VLCADATISLEPEGNAAYFTHLLRVAGHGPKRTISVINIKGSELQPISGAFRVVPIVVGKWPEPFQAILVDETVHQ
jgi:hypothetical protein